MILVENTRYIDTAVFRLHFLMSRFSCTYVGVGRYRRLIALGGRRGELLSEIEQKQVD